MDRKKLVSIRVRSQDVDKIRDIAQRIGVRESDLFRFAVKLLLSRSMPLRNPDLQGRELIPLLMEFGTELANYFQFDAERLGRIVNEGVDDPDKWVDVRDIEMLIMSSTQESYAYLRLKELTHCEVEPPGVTGMIRQYIYEKYMGKEGSPLMPSVEFGERVTAKASMTNKEKQI